MMIKIPEYMRSLDRTFNCSGLNGGKTVSVGLGPQVSLPGGDHYYVSLRVSGNEPVFGAALSLDDAHKLGEHLDLLSAIGMGETILESPPPPKTYPLTQPELAQLADAIALLDWVKNRLPDECPEKSEAAGVSARCHALIETLLGDDAKSVYGPAETEETPA